MKKLDNASTLIMVIQKVNELMEHVLLTDNEITAMGRDIYKFSKINKKADSNPDNSDQELREIEDILLRGEPQTPKFDTTYLKQSYIDERIRIINKTASIIQEYIKLKGGLKNE